MFLPDRPRFERFSGVRVPKGSGVFALGKISLYDLMKNEKHVYPGKEGNFFS